MIAKTPAPPYYAVIFSSRRKGGEDSYAEAAAKMSLMAAEQSGYLGEESTRDESGFGITVSYWSDETAIRSWKEQVDHALVQAIGRERWYSEYSVRVCLVERAYGFSA